MEEVKQVLAEYGQDHLFSYIDQCDKDEMSRLIDDIKSIDFKGTYCQIEAALSTKSRSADEELEKIMEPLTSEVIASVRTSSAEKLEEYHSVGLGAIGKSEIGIILLAGGQGTRLGVPYPKGMYDIGLPSGKSLYQIQMERIRTLQKLSGETGNVLVYIMTSEHTLEPTRNFFEERRFFGLKKENVTFFEQKMIPCFDCEGKVILEKKDKIARSPDGNGGLYLALRDQKILDHMLERRVKYVHVYCVDNVLVRIADPIFMGYCIQKNVEVGTKVVVKNSPTEAVGVVCRVDGKYRVVEYSEISQKTAEMRNPKGELVYNAGSFCNHFFTVDFLSRICDLKENKISNMPQHKCLKKIPFFDGKSTITPCTNNGIKLEKFVFDVFEFTDRLAVWDCLRDEEFSPLKNKDSAPKDNSITARNALFDLHRKYVLRAGGDVENEGPIEISPLLSYAGENISERVKGQKLSCPILIE